MGWGKIWDIVNKLIPSRKAAAIDELNALNVEYAKALKENRDTEAAIIKKKMNKLRQKYGITEGEV